MNAAKFDSQLAKLWRPTEFLTHKLMILNLEISEYFLSCSVQFLTQESGGFVDTGRPRFLNS